MSTCACGRHDSELAHRAAVDAALDAVVETALLRAVLPHAPTRRALLRAVGTGGVLAAISETLPVA
jgi:nitrate/nitrite transport system substrate-binding protein